MANTSLLDHKQTHLGTKQFRTKAAASPSTLYAVSLSVPGRNHNKQTDRQRQETETDRQAERARLLHCWRGVWYLANLNQKTITHGQGRQNWLESPDKFYTRRYLFLLCCKGFINVQYGSSRVDLELELELKPRLRLEGKQKQDLCIVA